MINRRRRAHTAAPTNRDARAVVQAMRRRQSSTITCCGYEPTGEDVHISPVTRRALRAALLLVVIALVVLAAKVL